MAGSLNRVTLIGNCGKDPEIRQAGNGNRVATFSIATSESWTDKASGERKEKTEWHNVVVWNDGLIGVIEKYVKKGSKVMVEGQMQTRKWEKEGIERYTTEVVLQGFGGQLILLGDAGGGGNRPPPPSEPPAGRPSNSYGDAKGKPAGEQKNFNDEIPF